MHSSWNIIVEHLRNELQGYGGLLQLFDEQQSNLLRGDSDAVLSYAHEIEAQVKVAAELRDRREQTVGAFAAEVGRPVETTLKKLLPLFPADVQPLLAALINEVNHLIHRVRRGATRNHQLLSCAVDLHRETLRMLRPSAFIKTYSPQGQVSMSPSNSAWQAAG